MSRNNTGNPIGSKAFPDFEDNVKNLDQAVNAPQDTFQDRLGKSRLTWAGMESGFGAGQVSREQRFRTFIASSGYQFAGEYAAGVEITQYNQILRDENGEFWRVSGQVDLPYTTTGTGLPEDDAFVPAGDAVLRQDLASPNGAEMVKMESGASVQSGIEYLNAKADRTYSSALDFQPNIVAREPGYHCAFGSIERVRYLNNIQTGNLNLAVYRRGINHQNDGIIRGVYVSDDATPAGEPFTIASPAMFPNIGRGGTASPNDFRDPNVVLLPDGRVLLTFFAINFEPDATRTQYESYAMIGTFSDSFLTFSWSPPVLMLDVPGNLVYGKPIVVGDMVYTASYTGPWAGDTGPTFDYLVLGANISDLSSWSVVGVPFLSGTIDSSHTEPVLRQRPGGGYFIQFRHEQGGRSIRRVDADSIDGPWSSPVVIFEGSSQAKGLEFMSDGLYFTGIRYFGDRPGVAILSTHEPADTPVPLHVSGVVAMSYIGSGEGGYVEFTKLSDQEWLGIYHTDTGETIECWRFTDAMIRHKVVKESTVFTGRRRIGAETLDPLIHVGHGSSRSFNLISNPLLKVPHGFPRAPGWSGVSVQVSDGLETDGPGPGFAKVTTSGGSVTHRLPKTLSRVFQQDYVSVAARVYCRSADRVRLAFAFGSTVYSIYHEGRGWQTMTILLSSQLRMRTPSNGLADSLASVYFQVPSGAIVTYFVDWISAGFGETVPEPINESAMKMERIVRLNLPQQVNTFNLVDLGIQTPAPNTYLVSLIQARFQLNGYTASVTSTGFTITLGEGSAWGSGARADFEIIGA